MIYTLTVNPAIDYHMELSESGLIPGEINRSKGEEMFPGGKGLNVTLVLRELGIDSQAWGYVAGKTGALLEALVQERGCCYDFIHLPEGETRINVKLDCEQETAINGGGPAIKRAQIDELLSRAGALKEGDILILSGNLQAGSVNLYEALCQVTEGSGVRIVVDTEGENLRNTFRYHPFLIKPNGEELISLYHSKDKSLPSIISLMRSCQKEGVQNVFVTLGGEGALLLWADGTLYRAEIRTEQKVCSTVGAGDSAVAGFLAGMARYGQAPEQLLRLACAAGTATAGQKWLCSGSQAEEMMSRIKVSKVVDPLLLNSKSGE